MRILFFLALATLVGCYKPSGPRRCYGDVDCSDRRVCVQLDSNAQTCVARCDATVDLVCAGGEACAALDGATAEDAVCLPGGETVVGNRCVVSSECVVGALCVARGGSLESHCEAVCSLDDPEACGGAASCEPLDEDPASLRGGCVLF